MFSSLYTATHSKYFCSDIWNDTIVSNTLYQLCLTRGRRFCAANLGFRRS